MDQILEALEKNGLKSRHIEGAKSKHWILIDCHDIIVHIFLDSVREIYRLENLWHTAQKISLGK
jgi:ribosome-associated protein